MDETKRKEIKDAIMQKQAVTIPQIQKEFSLGYFDAKSIVNELIGQDNLVYKGDITYEVQREEDDDEDDIFSSFESDDSPFGSRRVGGPFAPRRDFIRRDTIRREPRKTSRDSAIPAGRRIVTEFGSRLYTITDELRATIAKLNIVSCSDLKKLIEEVDKMKKSGKPFLHIYTTLDVKINEKILKFELIEGLLKNNSFRTKKDWVAKMQEECDILSNYAPPILNEYIEQALKEFKGLTLANIRETKKIIDDSKIDLDVETTTVESDDDDDGDDDE